MQDTEQYTNSSVLMSLVEPVNPMAFEPLDPAYKKMNTVIWFGILGCTLVAGLVSNLFYGTLDRISQEGVEPVLIAALIGLTLTGIILPGALWRTQGFLLRDHDLHYRYGIVWKHIVSLPYNRIQHIELESNPLERMFKLGTLKFFTAGGGSADMTIHGLSFSEASKLRAFVLSRAAEKENIAEPQGANNDE
jgi:membrane protein YdbS with pleckstrin-like domain